MPRTTQSHDHHKLAIAAALRELERELDLFVQSLSHQAALVAAEGAATSQDALRRICEAYAAIDYDPEAEANRSPMCLGVVGANQSLIARAVAVNRAKAALRDACAPLQDMRIRLPVKDGKGGRVVKALPLVRVILRELQRSDLNLLAAYRKIPILSGRIERVAYTRARTRAVYRKTRDEIAALVGHPDRPGAEADLKRLQKLPPQETHLALVKEHYANVRANVWFHGLDARNRGRAQIAAELPLLYPIGRSKELPVIRYSDAEEGTRTVVKPRTGKLEDDPFLETLPVYRYRPDRRRSTHR